MALIKHGRNVGVFTPERPIEKHFHDHDETWVILEGTARAHLVDREGAHHEFHLEPGDVWMIEVGCEHEATPTTPEFRLTYVPGTIPPGAHPPGHYYLEQERYIPSLQLVKTPTTRYG